MRGEIYRKRKAWCPKSQDTKLEERVLAGREGG